MKYSKFERTNFQNTNLKDSEFQNALVEKANFVNANLHDSNFNGTYILKSNMTGADMSFTYMRETDITNANLKGTYFFSISESPISIQEANNRDAIPTLERYKLMKKLMKEMIQDAYRELLNE